MILKLYFLFLILLQSTYIAIEQPSNVMVIWDVGQGQWVTYHDKNVCLHFDSGGEYAPIKKIADLCKDSKNYFYFTHSDQDHINKYKKIIRFINEHCIANQPLLLTAKLNTKNIKPCKEKMSFVHTLYKPRKINLKKMNESSHVFTLLKTVLISGDSTSKNENYWARKKEISNIKILIAGHHGSLTSTSDLLIKNLIQLKMVIVSARKKKYGHPHGIIQLKLLKNKTPIISTNDWGSVWIQL